MKLGITRVENRSSDSMIHSGGWIPWGMGNDHVDVGRAEVVFGLLQAPGDGIGRSHQHFGEGLAELA